MLAHPHSAGRQIPVLLDQERADDVTSSVTLKLKSYFCSLLCDVCPSAPLLTRCIRPSHPLQQQHAPGRMMLPSVLTCPLDQTGGRLRMMQFFL
eukprot:756082-Hanusia_phi.AAC.1